MKDITKWWIDYIPLNEKEQHLITKVNSTSPQESSDIEFDEIEREYFSRMPFCNISENTHHITFSSCATDFINGLFEKYVDNETLVIHSNNEHDNVVKNWQQCKNTLEVNYDTEIKPLNVHRIINESKKYKKVFVYIIGTQISTGQITPQLFFEKLKEQFIINNIKHTIVLDDVHGMFLTPRDYSIFDYVLYTAHALIKKYDMGIMVSKDKFMGNQAINWGKEYLEMLDVILKRKEKMRLFPQIMREEFYEEILSNQCQLCDYVTPHIFSLKTNGMRFTTQMYERLNNYNIRLEGIDKPNTYIRFRAQHYIQHPEYLTKGLEMVYNIMESSIYM